MAPIRSRCRMKVSLFNHSPFAACGSPTSGLVEKRSTASKPICNGRPRGGVNPGLGQDLALAPASALEKKLPQPGHVARVHLEVAPTVSIPSRIRGPGDVKNNGGFKKPLPGGRHR